MKNRFDDKYDKNPNNIKKMNFQFKNIISSPKYINNLIFNIKISNIKNKVHKIKTDKRKNIDNYARKIIINNINKYDAKKGEIEINIINILIKDESTHINLFSMKEAFKYNMIFFQCVATIFFCYTCHIGAFPIYKSLKNNISRRINKVFRRSIILDTIIYLFVAV